MKSYLHFALRQGLLALCLVCFILQREGMAQWYWQNPYPTGNILKDVQFIDHNTIFAVGGGSILKSTNGGFTWTASLVTSSTLYAISFTDGSNGTAVGSSGTILRTTNGGLTWNTQTSGTSSTLSGVHFSDLNTGTAVGGTTILRTTNGGSLWFPQTNTASLAEVFFTDANNGVAVGSSGKIIRTLDGGTNWFEQPSGTTSPLEGVFFSDMNNGTIVGWSGLILRTTDGGNSWLQQFSGTTSIIYDVHFTDSSHGTALSSTEIFRTTNAGVNWVLQSSGASGLSAICFSDVNTGMAVGIGGTILKTTNGGTNWNFLSTRVTSNTLEGVSFTDPFNGTAVGQAGVVARTTNGGAVWTLQTSGTTAALYAVSFSDKNNGTAVGSSGTIIRTKDGGLTWQSQTSGTYSTFYGVSFTDSTTGTAVGTSGTIRRTTNAGETWIAQSAGTSNWLGAVSFTDALHGTAVGNAAEIIRTNDGGTTWIHQSTTVTNDLNGCSFCDADNGYAVADNGWVIKTTNGGVNWISMGRASSSDLNAVACFSPDNMIAVADGPVVTKTINGSTLFWETSLCGGLAVCYNDAYNQTAVGGGGTIIGTMTPWPKIVYDFLPNTSLATNRILSNVIIIDANGINVTPGTAPRIYFKRVTDDNTYVDNTSVTNGWKYTETPGSTSPFSFIIDYSLLYGADGVTTGDTVMYFVTAQDIEENVGIYSGSFAFQPISVNLTAAAFPVMGTASYYINTALNGTVTVGTGGTYPTLTGEGGLFKTINSNIITGNITAMVLSDITEPGTYSLNEWTEDGIGGYTLSIQPDAPLLRSLTGSYQGALIRLNGADRVTFDGHFMGSGNFLRIENQSLFDTTAAIHLISLGAGAGSTQNVIRNCIIKAGSNDPGRRVMGIAVGGSTVGSNGADNNNNSLIGNMISRCNYGIDIYGTSSGKINNTEISGNIIGSANPGEYVTSYGIYTSYSDGMNISTNEIYNMVANGNKYGLYFDFGVANTVIINNRIHSFGQTNATTNYYVHGMYFSIGQNIRIENNMIYNLNNYGSTSNYLAGIRIAGGSEYDIYNNSISLSGGFENPAAGLSSSCFQISVQGVTNIDLQNNIFSNTKTGNSPKSYSFNIALGTTYLVMDHNDYFSTCGVLGIYMGTEITSLVDLKLASGQNGNSFNVDPLFTSITDLHINSGFTSILLESGGEMIPGISTDIDGDIRPGPAGSVNGGATSYDIGADEFDGVPSAGMVYSSGTAIQPNQNFILPGSSNNEIIGIVITTTNEADPLMLQSLSFGTAGTTSLADISNAKVWYTGSNPEFSAGRQFGNAVSPVTPEFIITGNQALITGVNYFWLTFDIPAGAPGNVIDAQCSLISVDGALYIPDVADPIGSRYIMGSFSGTYNIGTGEMFNTLTSAFNTLNTVGISGSVTFNLVDSVYSSRETFPLILNQVQGAGADSRITFKPANGISSTVRGAAASIIKLYGADFVTIDGSNSGGNDRNLFIQNSATIGNTAVIWISSLGNSLGATNNTIKNCNITGGTKTGTSQFGIFAGGTSINLSVSGPNNNDLVIENNLINKTYYGMYVCGTAAGVNAGLMIIGNIIGSENSDYSIGKCGLYLAHANAAGISGNRLLNIQSSSDYPEGMHIGGFVNSIISGNEIYDIKYTGTSGSTWGIYLSPGSAFSNITIVNNVIHSIGGNGYSYGLFLTGTIGGVKIYYNSVHLSGITGHNTQTFSSALYIPSAATALDIRDNVFGNSIFNSLSLSKAYCIYNTGTASVFSQINHNDYFAGGAQSLLGYQQTDIITIDDWRAATLQDVKSISVDPLFNADFNLRPRIGSPLLGAGIPIPGIPHDFLGLLRNGTAPSIGAYETGADVLGPSITFTTAGNTTSLLSRTLADVIISDASGIDVNLFKPRLYFKRTSDTDVFAGNSSADNGWKWTETAQAATPFEFLFDYSLLFGGSALVNDTIMYFITAQDIAGLVNANPSSGFNAISVAYVISAPSLPYKYKIIGNALSGDYVIGLSAFNTLNNRHLTLETRKRTVKTQIPADLENYQVEGTSQNKITENNSIAVSSALRSSGEELTSSIAVEVDQSAEYDVILKQSVPKEISYVTIEKTEDYPVLVEKGKIFEWKSFDQRKEEGILEGVYPTITAAIADAVERGVAGPVSFLLADSIYTEVYPVNIPFIRGATFLNTVTFKPMPGVNSTLYAVNPSTAVFNLDGAQFITFDGTNTAGGTSRNLVLHCSNSYSPIFRLINEACFNTFKNCILRTDAGSTVGVVSLLGTNSTRGNTNNRILNNRFETGSSDYSIYSTGVTARPNDSTVISGNEFVELNIRGINALAGSGSAWIISDNHFFSSGDIINTIPIYLGAGVGSGSHIVRGNFIGGTSPGAGDEPLITTYSFTGISLNIDTVNISTIENNVIRNIKVQSTGSSSFTGIAVSSGCVNIVDNQIGDTAAVNGISSTSTYPIYGIRIQAGNYAVKSACSGNIIGSLKALGTGTFVEARGISQEATFNAEYRNNRIINLSSASTVSGIANTRYAALGIYINQGTTFASPVISDNIISNIGADNTAPVATLAAAILANNFDGAISGNKIYDIKNASTGSIIQLPPIAAGIILNYPRGNNVVSNNMISLGNDTNSVSFAGILNVKGNYDQSLRLYHNTIHIGGTSTGPLNSYCFQRGYNDTTAVMTPLSIKNNIFDNGRLGGTGKHYAIHNRYSSYGWSSGISDNNLLNSSSTVTIGNWLGNDTDIDTWIILTGCDLQSISGKQVIYNNASAGDLHINSGPDSTALESAGQAGLPCLYDIDGDVRPGPAGSVNGGATAPDLGADEFDGVPSIDEYFQFSTLIAGGWNMVSIPGLNPFGQDVNLWYPYKDSTAFVFRYCGTFQAVNQLEPGSGYWLKHNEFRQYNTGDEWPARGLMRVANNPIGCSQGWNLIGGYEQSAQVSGITTTPAGLLLGSVYQYSGSGYTAAAAIIPGAAYWVFLTAAGSLNLLSGGEAGEQIIAKNPLEDFGKIIITDSEQRKYTLYAAVGETDLNSFALPPLPPEGMFDIRYSTHRLAENLETSKGIELRGAAYPVSILCEGINIILTDDAGNEIARLKDGEEAVLDNPVNKLMVMETIIPTAYSLEQNYPNPFNPSTTIQFSLPEDVKNVKIIIYTSLGEKVSEIINTSLQAGVYKYKLDASGLASGMYIYQIITEKFNGVKKMMVLK